jgi:hypothetical protein
MPEIPSNHSNLSPIDFRCHLLMADLSCLMHMRWPTAHAASHMCCTQRQPSIHTPDLLHSVRVSQRGSYRRKRQRPTSTPPPPPRPRGATGGRVSCACGLILGGLGRLLQPAVGLLDNRVLDALRCGVQATSKGRTCRGRDANRTAKGESNETVQRESHLTRDALSAALRTDLRQWAVCHTENMSTQEGANEAPTS